MGRPRLVILGTGWGGFRIAKDICKASYDVTIVSPRNHFLFTPLLCSTTVGTLEFRSVVEPVRQTVPTANFHQAECLGIDFAKQTLTCRPSFDFEEAFGNSPDFQLPYDHLIISIGARSETFGTPGASEHCEFIKEVQDAQRLRTKIIDRFERAAQPSVSLAKKKQLLHFVVVGAGPTGVEFIGELYDFVKQDLSRAFPHLKQYINISLVDPAGSVLASFNDKLVDYTLNRLKSRNINLMKAKVSEVTPQGLITSTGEEVKAGLVVWSAGVKPPQLIEDLDALSDKQSRKLVVDEHLHVAKPEATLSQGPSGEEGSGSIDHVYPNVYAIGDCARIHRNILPATAQVAHQQAIWLSKSLNKQAKKQIPIRSQRPFRFMQLGQMAYLGGHKALVELGGHIKASGFISWLVWRSAYMTRLVSYRNKVLVPMIWFKTFFFGRDTSYLHTYLPSKQDQARAQKKAEDSK